ncbi:tandem-95 repeat protein [Fuerstiella marisgermanici]|uniref:Rhombotarget A n=1 Tax=Fuerstiella marisgermanici TaxID=1891926 RepID=A0A1P8WRB9_9PLAN|nr:tandem-95 repeat protein [Fuerstiella marisgermanici]APZ96606.1 rhombotarget A [Fuerstiella marisgermanici]
MLSGMKRLFKRREARSRLTSRRRRFGQSLERLELRELLAADLEFSTFFPSTPMEDGVAAIAQDSAGNAYVSDYRYDAVTFELEGSVSKLSPSGSLLWSQELPEYALEIAVDDSGFVYLAAATSQIDLPTTADAHQLGLAGGTDFHVMVLDGNAIDADPETLSESELVYASYLGGTGTEGQNFIGLATDADGGIYLAGETYSTDFPVTSQAGVDSSLGGDRDGVVAHFARLSSGDYSLSMSSYLGGSEGDRINDLDLDANGIIHVVGSTGSEDYPLTPNAIQTESPPNPIFNSIGFVTRLTADAEITFSTFLGGDKISDVVADASGNTYVVGSGGREGFPTTPGAFAPEEILAEDNETRLRGDFASKISPSGELEYSSWFQLSRDVLQIGNDSIALDGDRVVITAMDIGGVDRTSFFIRFDSDFSRLLDYTDVDEQLGNLSWITSSGIIDGSLYVGGATQSASFATTTNAIYPNKNDGLDGFVRRYDLGESAVGSVSDITVSEGGVATVTVSLAQPWPTDVAVEYDTIELESRLRPDDYAVAGDDYVATSGTLVIPAGSTSASIDIDVLEDALLDANEYFTVALTNFDGIGLNTSRVKVNIVDDDFSALDDFDSGVPDGGTGPWANDWDLTGNSAFTSSSSPNDGNLHAIVQRRGVLTRQLDTTGVSNLNLSFASKLRSFENSDNAYVRVSSDGSNWTTLKSFGNGEDDNNYRDYSYDIPFEADTLWIKFEGDMSSSRWDYWYIDTVSVTGEIIPSDPPPNASHDSFATNEDESLTVGAPGVLANDTDPEGQPLTASLVTGPSNGTLTLNADGSFDYAPAPNFHGTDTFVYVASDGISDSSPATVTIAVTAINDAPQAADDSTTTGEDQPVDIAVLLNDSDVDGNSLTIDSAQDGSLGTISINANGTLTYTPASGFFGSDQFTYTISDGNGGLDTASVMVTVEERNDPPVASGDSDATAEDMAVLIDVLANDSDPDGDTLSIQSVSEAAFGTAVIVNGQIEYTPGTNFNGSDSFTYMIVDTAGQTAVATVDVTVTPVNDAPAAGANSYSLNQDSTLTIDAPGILADDSDIDGDTLTAALGSGPATGSLTLNADGSFAYTPDAGFVGSDSFTYHAVDTSGAVSDPVTVSLQVNAVVAGPNLSHGNLSSVTSSWQTVSLGTSYTSAVIVATPRYNDGSGPGVVRISNVTETSFDVRVDNAGLSPFSGGVHFIAVEEGAYDVPGEYKLEAVKVDSSVTSGKIGGWQVGSQGYQQAYSSPVVVGQVMSANDEDWSVFWSSSSSRTSPANSGSLNIGKHVAEDTDTTRANETLGYFVIEATSGGTINGLSFSAGVGGDTIRGVGNGTYRYGSVTPAGASTAVLSSAGMDGGDGGWAALMGTNPLPSNGGSIDLAVDEDQIRDSERNHTTEQVAYFVIGESDGQGAAAGTMAQRQITVHDPLDVNGFSYPIGAMQVINPLNADTATEKEDMARDTSVNESPVINKLNAASESVARSSSNAQAIDGYFATLEDDEEEFLFGFELI